MVLLLVRHSLDLTGGSDPKPPPPHSVPRAGLCVLEVVLLSYSLFSLVPHLPHSSPQTGLAKGQADSRYSVFSEREQEGKDVFLSWDDLQGPPYPCSPGLQASAGGRVHTGKGPPWSRLPREQGAPAEGERRGCGASVLSAGPGLLPQQGLLLAQLRACPGPAAPFPCPQSRLPSHVPAQGGVGPGGSSRGAGSSLLARGVASAAAPAQPLRGDSGLGSGGSPALDPGGCPAAPSAPPTSLGTGSGRP